MNVVGHEAVCKKAQTVVPAAVPQQPQVIEAIGFIAKDIKSPRASLGDMHGDARHDNTSSSRHSFVWRCTARKFLGAERKGKAMMALVKPRGKDELSLRHRISGGSTGLRTIANFEFSSFSQRLGSC